MVESVQSITLFPFKFSTFQFAVCKAYDNGQVIALDGDTKNSTYSLALRVLWLSKTLWAWPWVVLLGAVPSPSPARLQHSLHVPLITWEWQQFPRPQLTSVDLIVVFQLVCCFLNEFNVGNIFLIKFVMSLLYPWVSIVRCHVSVTLQYLPHLLKHLSLYFIPSVGSCNYAFANKHKSQLWGRREEVHVYTGKS